MKKTLAFVLSLVLVLAVLPLAASARNLTAGEKSIFDACREATTVADGAFKLPENTIKQGENYLAGTDTELTPAQIDEILSYIADAKGAVKDANTGVTAKWTTETKKQILGDIDKAAQVVDLAARGNATGAVEVFDPQTNQVAVAQDHLVKVTGAQTEAFVIAGVCALAVLCGCAFVCKKVELF